MFGVPRGKSSSVRDLLFDRTEETILADFDNMKNIAMFDIWKYATTKRPQFVHFVAIWKPFPARAELYLLLDFC